MSRDGTGPISAGWRVEIAEAQKAKGLAPPARKTDRIDARVLAELSRRDLVPAIWLPPSRVRPEREQERWRLHLVRHRTALKNRIHSALLGFGHPCPVSDLFGTAGRELLAKLALPEPWGSDAEAAVGLTGIIDQQIGAIETKLRVDGANHPYVPLLMTVPRVGWRLGYTIAVELGNISRFASPSKLCGFTGLCPKVYQSRGKDHRGPLSKNGLTYLRWALIESATHAFSHSAYAQHYKRTAKRLGLQRGKKVAREELARTLAEAMWYMLTRQVPFAPARPTLAPAA